MKENRKYSVNVFSQVLLGLLAVFYVSIFLIEAIHSHESSIEVSSPDGSENGPDTDDCKVCAYFAHHEKEEIVVSTIISFALFLFRDDTLTTLELTSCYQTSVQYFINRGPPYLFL